MPCNRPVLIPLKEGNKRVVGANGVSFVEVPCGKCLGCKRDRTKAWAIRLMLETLSWSDCCFITLTYSPETVPLVDSKEYVEQGMTHLPYTLCKSDLQKFFKRLRRDLDGKKIKYYAVGEYGETTFRPHYHAIVFGLGYYDYDLIKDNWDKGIVDIGNVELASCNYVAGYIQKKLYGDVGADVYGLRQKPFSCMSKGLGKDYFIRHFQELLDKGFIRYQGKKIPLPRYFWKVMIDDDSVPLSKSDVDLIRHASFGDSTRNLINNYARNGVFGDTLIFQKEKEKEEMREYELKKKAQYRSSKL